MMINIHAIFLLLGTVGGELIKKVIEFILFTLITYMTASEYTRAPRKELKYLLAAFGMFSLQSLISTSILANIVFGNLSISAYTYFFAILSKTMEISALVMLAYAFLFPFLRSKKRSLKKDLRLLFIIITSIYLILQLIQGYEYITCNRGPVIWLSNILFTSIKLILVLVPIYILSTRTDIRYRYRYSTIAAFMVYLVDPFLKFIAYVFYHGTAARIFVAAQPFPLIAIILFTRVMFLKLADKAYLKRQLAHEKELGKMKNKFVSIVSHELRTPLTSIGLYSSLLKDGKMGKISKKQKNAAKIIKDESKRLTGLVNDILDLSKIESKKTDLNISEFNIFAFFKDTMHKDLAEQKKISVINKIPKNFMIKADPEKFTQVLINLFSNAVKYTKKDGKITLSAKKIKDKIKIDITDTGEGIPPDKLKKIFDKFYQVESYMTRQQGGSGLGLAIAAEIVKMHKGEIKVESKLRKGSTFSIIIPS